MAIVLAPELSIIESLLRGKPELELSHPGTLRNGNLPEEWLHAIQGDHDPGGHTLACVQALGAV
jgi:hypothetical protein